MLFGQKSKKGKYVDDGQMTLDEDVFNKSEAESNPALLSLFQSQFILGD